MTTALTPQLSATEKLAVAASSCVLGALALAACLMVSIPPTYSEFIVGSITWSAETKFQDLIAAPVVITVWFLAFVFLLHQLGRQKNMLGAEYSEEVSRQYLWWSLPALAAIFGLLVGGVIDQKILIISSLGICFVAAATVHRTSRSAGVDGQVVSLVALSILLIGLVPLEVALALGRLPESLVGKVNVATYARATYLLIGLGFAVGLCLAISFESRLTTILARLILAGQLGLPILYLTLYPARLVEPDGSLGSYETTAGLKILIGGVMVWGVLDVANRYRAFAGGRTDWGRLFSPIALFGLFVGLRIGNTFAPNISPDDYHFGESLLGWWSYLHGALPYIDYIPPHGLIDDDFTGFLSYLFYDGSAGSMAEASRLAFCILAFVAFNAIYRFSGSIGLAFVSTFFLAGRLAWLFLTPFLCLWFGRELRQHPAWWLGVWLLAAPIVVLGVPPQGLLLVAASGIMALYYIIRLIRCPEEREWKGLAAILATLGFLVIFTPFESMLIGAVRYVVENASVNQLAYGLQWSLSWAGEPGKSYVSELIRMSWVAIPIVCLAIIHGTLRTRNRTFAEWEVLLPACVVLLFMMLLVPYSMGRIDPGAMSRPGLVASFGWAVLLPIVAWWHVKRKSRAPLVVLMVCMSAGIGFVSMSLTNVVSATSPVVGTAPLRDGQSAGMPNLGRAHVTDQHWDRLTRLKALLASELGPNESYLDLTSRNAHYFYLDRRPMMSVTAAYNLVPRSQQKRELERLLQNPPPLVLLEGDNIVHDGGGLALRNPYLYRFVLDGYVPRFQNGFVFAVPRERFSGGSEATIPINLRDFTDENWNRGVNRSEAAVVIEDGALMPLLEVGTQVRIGTDDVRRIERVWLDGSAIWLDGPALDPSVYGYPNPNRIHVVATRRMQSEYQLSLLQKAFPLSDLGRIPVAWGRSENALSRRMLFVEELDGFAPSLHDLVADGEGFSVTGADPYLTMDISSLSLSGSDADLLKFDFSCIGVGAEPPKMQVFWWGAGSDGPAEAASIKFIADGSPLIVPLDASPRWVMTGHVAGIRIDLDGASACSSFSVGDIGLFSRRG